MGVALSAGRGRSLESKQARPGYGLPPSRGIAKEDPAALRRRPFPDFLNLLRTVVGGGQIIAALKGRLRGVDDGSCL